MEDVGLTGRRVANAVIGGAAGVFAIAALYALVVGGAANLVPRVLPATVLSVGAASMFLLDERRRIAAAVLIAGLMVGVWGADLVLAQFPLPVTPEEQRVRIATAAGVDMDPRSALLVSAQLRRAGFDAYPVVYVGNYWRGARQFADTIYPLGGIGDVVSVMCNEGRFVIYRSDERGLTNRLGAWRGGMPAVDLAAVGDSYTQGWCVRPESSFAARIADRYPATLVVGFGASGPLTQLAQIREFLTSRRPRAVLWFYFEGNDLADLTYEVGNPILKRYLESGFSQRLEERQEVVNARLKAFAAYREQRAARADSIAVDTMPRTTKEKISSVARVTHLRERIALLRRKTPERPCCDLALYGRIVREARTLVEGWGGRLTVVYLPSEPRLAGRQLNAGERAGDSVVALLTSLEVPVLDLRTALPALGTARELNVFPNSHYSVRGHGAVATLVLRYLADRDSVWGLRTTVAGK